MKVLTFDLGSDCGWCLLDTEERRWRWGRVDLTKRKGEAEARRWVRFERHLEEFAAVGIDLVVFERVDFSKYQMAAAVLERCRAILTAFFEKREIPCRGVPVKTLKKFATGNGNADKDLMRICAERVFGEVLGKTLSPRTSSDEIDALWLARYAQQKILPTFQPAYAGPELPF